MPSRRGRSLLLTACLVLGGCSEEGGPSRAAVPRQSAAARADQTPRAESERDQKRKRHGSKRSARGDGGSGRDEQAPAGSSSDQATDRPQKVAGPGERGVATASASRSDPSGDGDRQGDPPGYADIRRAAVTGAGEAVRFTIGVDDLIPRGGTGQGENLTASFHLRMRDGDEHQIYAIGSSSGWRADLDNSGRFPGRFALDGDRFLFELTWEHLGGVRRLKWLAQTSWTRSAEGPLDETDFAFDQVPEYERASYPE